MTSASASEARAVISRATQLRLDVTSPKSSLIGAFSTKDFKRKPLERGVLQLETDLMVSEEKRREGDATTVALRSSNEDLQATVIEVNLKLSDTQKELGDAQKEIVHLVRQLARHKASMPDPTEEELTAEKQALSLESSFASATSDGKDDEGDGDVDGNAADNLALLVAGAPDPTGDPKPEKGKKGKKGRKEAKGDSTPDKKT
jgi:hypothetical protein